MIIMSFLILFQLINNTSFSIKIHYQKSIISIIERYTRNGIHVNFDNRFPITSLCHQSANNIKGININFTKEKLYVSIISAINGLVS